MKSQSSSSLPIMAIAIVGFLMSLASPTEATSRVDGIAVAVPSLVHILIKPKATTSSAQPAAGEDSVLESPIEKMSNGSASGSGVIISSDGYIYSVDSLFEDGDKIQVWTSDKRQFDAKIVGRDRHRNIALLKIEASGLRAARIGDPMRVRLGEPIFSAGLSPEGLGLAPVITEGIVSTLNHTSVSDYFPMIQTTSQIGPGMGGGGLFNENGELLGLSAQVYVNKKLGQSISFSIPINEAMAILPALKQYGRVRRSSIGIRIGEVTEQVANALGLVYASGALVQAVEPGGAADNAGIRAGDVIVQFAERPIKRATDIPRTVGAIVPGATVSVKLWRRGQMTELPVTTRELLPK